MLQSLICFAPFMILYGLFKLIATDSVWTGQKMINDLQGIKSEHTSAWDSSQKLQGILLILFGVAIFCVASYNR